jgi:type VI secretion system protein ImpF
MSDPNLHASRQEAVQPSLWDRLVNDLPGVLAETSAMRRDLVSRLGAEADVDALIEGGPRAIERRTDLDDETRALARRLWQGESRKRLLEERGIVVTADVLREAVRRDIEMLFNVERLEAHHLMTDTEALETTDPADAVAGFPEVRTSVLNYGVPAFSGRLSSSFDADHLAREIKAILTIFEPRLRRDSVKVKAHYSAKTGMRIEIDALLMLTPVPERLRLSTRIDLDTGQAATTLEEV